MALTSTITINVKTTQTVSSDLGSASDVQTKSFSMPLATGTGASQADLVFHDQRTTDDTGEDLDLSGTLADKLGNTLAMAQVKAIFVFPSSSNTIDLEIGGAAANGFETWVGAAGDQVVVEPGGFFALGAPNASVYAVTASTGDLLHIQAASSGNVTYDIIIIGASA